MRNRNEDKLKALHQLTDEVFVISNKPQLGIVQKMKQIPCDIMATGIKKVAMDYFYCKTCDKEHKFPICKVCAERCHKGHLILDYIQANEDHPAICMCGYRGHNMINKKKEEEIDIEQNSSKCFFNDLSYAAGQYEYYIGINGKKICSFCYHFCCHCLNTNEDDEESRLKAFQRYKFKKITLNKKEFIHGLENGTIYCDCLTLNDSRHKFSDYLFIFINDLNSPYYNEIDDDNYFSNLSPTKIINLFFTSIELFESIYSSFISEYNEFIENLNQKNDRLTINSTLANGYTNFFNNGKNCNYNLYFNEKINVYFTTTLTKCLLEKNLKITEQNTKFIINYLQGYIKFRLGSYMEEMPRYLITDIFNLNPFQRRLWCEKCWNIFVSSGLRKDNLIKTVIYSIERIIRLRPDLEESIQLFIELLRIIKFYARFFFIKKEEIIEICKIFEDFFGYLSEFYANEESIEIPYKEKRIKLFKLTIKIITYFSVYINDDTFFSFFNLPNPFEEEEDTEKLFFHSFTEVSKLSNKILVLVSHAVRQEYEIVTYLISKKSKKQLSKQSNYDNINNIPDLIMDKQNKKMSSDNIETKNIEEEGSMSNIEYQTRLMRILHIIQINLDFNLQKNDVYLHGLLRSINKNLPLYYSLLVDNPQDNNLDENSIANFGKTISEFVDHLETLYYDFFNSTHITLDLIQEYIINVTNNLLSKFSVNLDSLIDNQGNVFICDYQNLFKDNQIENEDNNEMTYEFMLNKSPNFIYSLTKIFRLSKEKSVFSEELIRNIIKIIFVFIRENPDNCIIGLSIPVLRNLLKIPKPYLCCILDYMAMGLQILLKYNVELNIGFYIARFGFQIYHKTTNKSKSNKGITLSNSYHCLVKLFSLCELLFTFKLNDQNQYLNFIKPCLQSFMGDKLIENYKLYLLKIANHFKKYKKDYTSKRVFDNAEIFDKLFEPFMKVSSSLNSTLMFQIFFKLLKLITKAFDVNALEKVPEFLKSFFSPNDILKILSIITLDIPLRIQLIKYFRMIYIDLSIDRSKIEKYRFKFHEELDTEVEEMTDSLISLESMKVFLFLQRLIKVSNYDFNSYESQLEYDVVFFEIKNIRKIIMNSKNYDKKIYMSYIENGIILPIKIYLNKVLSMMMTIKGQGLLKLYRFCYYVLKMKEFIIESNIISNIPEEDKIDSVFKEQDFKGEDALNELKEDIATITSDNFTVLNYREIYLYINKHVMSLIEEPTSAELVLYLSEYQKYEEKSKESLKLKLKKTGIYLEQFLFREAWDAYECYIEQKNNFDKSSLKANFDDTLINGETTFRTIVLKYLFFLATNKAEIFEEEGVNMLLKLLKNEPDESQIAIFYQTEKEENKKANIKTRGKKDLVSNDGIQQVSSLKQKEIEDIYYMAKSCFDYILASIFGQYNPTSLELSDEYYNACHIIKVFKYLCEAHNQYFQKRLMNEITFDIGPNAQLNFYDMMLFVLDKIITMSSWEQLKGNDEVQDYFYALFTCLIELVIEIIRGSDTNNFKNFFNDEEDDNNENKLVYPFDDKKYKIEIKNKDIGQSKIKEAKKLEDEKYKNYKYEKGKALKVFLHNIRKIMFENTSKSEVLFSIRKNLMDFLLSFMEEVNCPMKIKTLIMSCYQPSIIIKSICTALKIYYLKNDIEIKKEEVKKENHKIEDNIKRYRTNQIVEQNLAATRLKEMESQKANLDQPEEEHKINHDDKKSFNKTLKRLKFNEELYEKFLRLYFDDTSFSETSIFALCNAYFKYFQLAYIQFKNEETIDFWNRVHNQTEENLTAYNKRNKLNKKYIFTTINDESDLEAYYIIKLFKEISKYILVKISPEIPPIFVIYTIHPYSKYLSSDSKSEFLRTVDRKNRYTKLYDLIESSEYFKLEIIYNWNYLRKSSLLKKSTEINYHMIGYFVFLASLILNFVNLSTLHNNGNDAYGFTTIVLVDVSSYICSAFVAIIVLFWFLTKYQLYYEIEKAKYREHHYDKININDSQFTFIDKFKINFETIMGKGELNPFLIFLFFTLLGSIYDSLRFLYSFNLLSILSLNQTLKNIALSFYIKGGILLWTSLFTFVLLYEYAGWAFFFQKDRFYETSGRDKPDEMCKSLIYCFLTMINNGLRWHCGVGKITRSESYILHFWAFVHRFLFDLIFFWLIEAIMLKIVYGIILDSFGELREAHNLIEKDMANNCFICNLEKDECEKNNISFKEHCDEVHNVWDYAFYMITLRMKDPTTLNAVNSRNRQKILEKRVDWLPDSSLDKIEDNHLKAEENLHMPKNRK